MYIFLFFSHSETTEIEHLQATKSYPEHRQGRQLCTVVKYYFYNLVIDMA